MQTKYRIDRDTRTLILKYIRKYDEYRAWYQCERDKILYPSIKPSDGMPKGTNISDPTLSAAERLERLDLTHRARVIKAIEQAKHLIGVDILQTLEQEETLRRCIWLSCVNAKEYPFEAFDGLVFISRRHFYRYKNKFMNDIKYLLGL
ncbi:hypothetical protein CE91St36_03160 [Christensenellaceae bacterium]|nr:hypothetical protein CE91St36_03160 [Christensenellaceae bacterium]BDF60167.1 hypothetical protein CE91St37_03170 [Christensenellaceae bacterium]